MVKQCAKTATPRLRFPEFRQAGDWTTASLGTLTQFVTERVGPSDCVPYTVTSGVGLVSQQEKIGRTIAGQSLKNYIVLERDDFAYNKSATKAYPQGFIARYGGRERAAVPNSIFTCFRLDNKEVHPIFLENLFVSNLHGNWLRGRIAVGARAHGSLNVSDDDLMALPVPLPPVARRREEQQKIADCLTSLDEVIAAQGRKVEALKAHKRGLMQQLFPREGKTRPRLRFPEFRDAPDWAQAPVRELFDTASGGTPDRSNPDYWGGSIPWVTTSLVNFNSITRTDEYISEAGLQSSSAKVFPQGTVVVAMYGQGKTRGQAALLQVEAATNQACAALLPNSEIAPWFVFFSFCGRYEELRALSNSGGQENLSQGLIRELMFSYPTNPEEQSRIVDCLSSLTTQITAETNQLAALKTHKQGLMQQLFPVPEVV